MWYLSAAGLEKNTHFKFSVTSLEKVINNDGDNIVQDNHCVSTVDV